MWETLREDGGWDRIKFTRLERHFLERFCNISFRDRREGVKGNASETKFRWTWMKRSLIKFSSQVVDF